MTQEDVFRHVGQIVLAHAQEKNHLLSELRRITDEANQRIQSLTGERDAALAKLAEAAPEVVPDPTVSTK